MGKRSDFERIEKDYYRTFDPRAGAALRPHLPLIYTYAEPFCGRGDLINQLSGHCLFASDISPDRENKLVGDNITFHQRDYKTITSPNLHGCDYIITNPPWSRPILHDSIEHFAKMKPTWFLFDAGWAFTKQASDLLSVYCEKIVSVGRLTWIEGTKTSGKDDVAWFLFDVNKKGDTKFYGRGY